MHLLSKHEMSVLPKILWIRGEAVLCVNGATLSNGGYLKMLKMEIINIFLLLTKTEVDVNRYLEWELSFCISLTKTLRHKFRLIVWGVFVLYRQKGSTRSWITLCRKPISAEWNESPFRGSYSFHQPQQMPWTTHLIFQCLQQGAVLAAQKGLAFLSLEEKNHFEISRIIPIYS